MSDETPSRDEMAVELTRLNTAFIQAETLAHNAELLLRSASDAYAAVDVARDAAYLLAGWRLGIPERAIHDGYIARFHDDVNTALGIAFREYGDLYPEATIAALHRRMAGTVLPLVDDSRFSELWPDRNLRLREIGQELGSVCKDRVDPELAAKTGPK